MIVSLYGASDLDSPPSKFPNINGLSCDSFALRFYNGPYSVLQDSNLVLKIRKLASNFKFGKAIIVGGRMESHSWILVPTFNLPAANALQDSEFAVEIEASLRVLSVLGDWNSRKKPLVFIRHQIQADRVLRILRDLVDTDLASDIGVVWIKDGQIYH